MEHQQHYRAPTKMHMNHNYNYNGNMQTKHSPLFDLHRSERGGRDLKRSK